MSVERIAYRRVVPGTAIIGRTGDETVVDTRDRCREITTVDALGRSHDYRRAGDGWWTISREPCDACRVPTAERVYNVDGGKGWTPLHHTAGCDRR